jgi:aldose 1-epimerase
MSPYSTFKKTAIFVSILFLWGNHMTAEAKGTITRAPFGKLPDGSAIELFTLKNTSGMTAKITNYGGIITHLFVPDKTGKQGDVVLGYDTFDGYLKASPYFGCIVGRYGNRIGGGKFTLGGKVYNLAKNNNGNSLHGGLVGFDKKAWKPEAGVGPHGPFLKLSYLSKDGEEGYPGNLSTTVTYTLTDQNELKIEYAATTDQETVLNLTNHTYFNLDGAGEILDHQLFLYADRFTPVDAGLIPTGELRSVKNTPLDFTKPMKIGARIESQEEQMKLGGGYDHNFVLNSGGGRLAPAAKVFSPTTGRLMEVLTSEPAIQFYTGNFLDGTITGKGGQVYAQRTGLCLETQHYPDSPNKPAFPSTVLKPGGRYATTTVYKFSVASGLSQ